MTASEWPVVPIKEVCEAVVDCVNKTAPTSERVTPYIMIRTTNVKSGFVNLEDVRTVELDIFEKWNRRTAPRRGDVILTREAPLGEVGMLRGNAKVFLGQRLMLYRADPCKLDPHFLLYSLQSDFLQGQIRSLGSGATVEHMRVPDAERLLVPLPPIELQARIGNILSAYDDLIENNTRRIKILEEMMQMIYREWFVIFRFPGHERVRMVESELGPIPEGWLPTKLGDLCTEVRRGVHPSEIDPETPYIGLEHMPRKSIALNEWGRAGDVGSTKLHFRRGEILFGKIRPYFHKVGVAPVDGVASSDAIVIVPKSETYFSAVICCVSSDDFVLHATQTSQGTKMPRANWDVLTKFSLPIPDATLLERFNETIQPLVEMLQNLVFRNRNLRTTRDCRSSSPVKFPLKPPTSKLPNSWSKLLELP